MSTVTEASTIDTDVMTVEPLDVSPWTNLARSYTEAARFAQDIGEQDAARSQRRPSALNHLPRLGKVENDSIDVVFGELGGDIAEFHRPIRRRTKITRDIFLRQLDKVLADLVRNELTVIANGAQQRHA